MIIYRSVVAVVLVALLLSVHILPSICVIPDILHFEFKATKQHVSKHELLKWVDRRVQKAVSEIYATVHMLEDIIQNLLTVIKEVYVSCVAVRVYAVICNCC